MGNIQKYHKVKLVAGFIFKKQEALKKAEILLGKQFGPIDFKSETLAFAWTKYYEKEFGNNLKRKFISFKELILPHELPKIKIITNQIESHMSSIGLLRLINIDPGYLDLARLILASTKDYIHRIYLGKGIFAELTLFYQRKAYRPWKWTYSDYRAKEYIAIFNKIREIYKGQ